MVERCVRYARNGYAMVSATMQIVSASRAALVVTVSRVPAARGDFVRLTGAPAPDAPAVRRNAGRGGAARFGRTRTVELRPSRRTVPAAALRRVPAMGRAPVRRA